MILLSRVSYLGEEPVRDDTSNDSSSLSPRGVIQSKDLDFSYYYLDCGTIWFIIKTSSDSAMTSSSWDSIDIIQSIA